jgi:hypothetical protein
VLIDRYTKQLIFPLPQKKKTMEDATILDYLKLKSAPKGKAGRVQLLKDLVSRDSTFDLRSVFVEFSDAALAELESEQTPAEWHKIKRWLGAEGLYGEFNELLLSWTVLHVAAYLRDEELVDYILEWETKWEASHPTPEVDLETGGAGGKRLSRRTSREGNSDASDATLGGVEKVATTKKSLVLMQDSMQRIPLDIAYFRYDHPDTTYSLFKKLTPKEKLTKQLVEGFAEAPSRTAKYQVFKFAVLQFVVLTELVVSTSSWAVRGLIFLAAILLIVLIFDKFVVPPKFGMNDSFTSLPSWDATSTNLLTVISIIKFVEFGEATDFSLTFLGIAMLLDDISAMMETLPSVVLLYGRRRLVPLLDVDAKLINEHDNLQQQQQNNNNNNTVHVEMSRTRAMMARYLKCKRTTVNVVRYMIMPVEIFGYVGLLASWIVFYAPAKIMAKALMYMRGGEQTVDSILSQYESEQPDRILAKSKLSEVTLIWCVVICSDLVFTALAIWFGIYSNIPVGANLLTNPVLPRSGTDSPTMSL